MDILYDQRDAELRYKVVKSNVLIQKAHFELGTLEQKVMLYIISKIQPNDEDFKTYELDVYELCEICGISFQTKNYNEFIDTITSLTERTIQIDDGRYHDWIYWLERPRFDRLNKRFYFRLDDRLKPYLLQLRGSFTQYALDNIMSMRSKYSIRLYELFLSYAELEVFYVPVDHLRSLLEAPEAYSEFKKFRQKVLNPALSEINDLSDIEVTMETKRTGRIITDLKFVIRRKDDTENLAARWKRMFGRDLVGAPQC